MSKLIGTDSFFDFKNMANVLQRDVKMHTFVQND